MASLRSLPAFLVVLLALPWRSSNARVPEASYPKAISDLKESIVKGLGFRSNDVKVSGFDLRDALVGRSVAYEFDVEIDKTVLPFRLLEDADKWQFVDLPIFSVEEPVRKGNENGLAKAKRKSNKDVPVLAPFQLAGPMEIWIQDAKDMRVSLPHNVDAGALKKVVLADGAVVTIKGARQVSLRHPIDLPLPLNRTANGFASGLLALAEHLRRASRNKKAPILSLRIVGPTELTSPSSSSSFHNKLELKRLAPGLAKLSSTSKPRDVETLSAFNPQKKTSTLLTPKHFATIWPLASVNVSNSNLLGFEQLLFSVLGPKANKKGSFKLLKTNVSAQTFMKISFGIEKKLKKGDAIHLQGFPEWRTKPEKMKMHFEVLAKVDGNKIVPERVVSVDPVMMKDTVAPNVLSRNQTVSTSPITQPPPKTFTL